MFITFSPDGKKLAAAAGSMVWVWDIVDKSELCIAKGHVGEVHMIDFSPDGTQILSTGDDHTVRIWEVDSAEAVATFDGHLEEVRRAFWNSKTGRVILAAGKQALMLEPDLGPGAPPPS